MKEGTEAPKAGENATVIAERKDLEISDARGTLASKTYSIQF